MITDLTEMHGGNFCVAGWDIQHLRMVRPLPGGANWTQPLLALHGIVPGATINVVPTGQPHASAYPHRMEDTPVDRAQIQLVNPGPINWFGPNAPGISINLAAVFGQALAHNSQWNGNYQGVHVPAGAQVNSLGAIVIPRGQLLFTEEFDKLKAFVNDGVHTYKVPVSSRLRKSAWRQGGTAAVIAGLPQSPNFHLRVGLARPFGQPPDKCYVMLNDVHG